MISHEKINNVEKVRNKQKDFLKEEKIDRKTGKTIFTKLKGPILDQYDNILGKFSKEIQNEKGGIKHTLITEEVYNDKNNKTTVVEEIYDSKTSSSRTKIVNGEFVFQVLKSNGMSILKEYEKGKVKNVYEYDEKGMPINSEYLFKGLKSIPCNDNFLNDCIEYEKVIDSIGVSGRVNEILNLPYQINPINERILSKANTELANEKNKKEKIK